MKMRTSIAFMIVGFVVVQSAQEKHLDVESFSENSNDQLLMPGIPSGQHTVDTSFVDTLVKNVKWNFKPVKNACGTLDTCYSHQRCCGGQYCCSLNDFQATCCDDDPRYCCPEGSKCCGDARSRWCCFANYDCSDVRNMCVFSGSVTSHLQPTMIGAFLFILTMAVQY